MRLRQSLICCLLFVFSTFSQASAWGPDGHHTVAAIADDMIADTHAATEVKAILGSINLEDAAVWADCAKGIDPSKNFTYQNPGKYPECTVFETRQGEAEMADFVRRNPKHNEYHYTDVAIQHHRYDRSFVGTRDDDIVGAVSAAIHVLNGDQSPAPFKIKDKREALLLLAHFAGDIHQPLHVGAVYLDAQGNEVDPDKGTFDPSTSTNGGNSIVADHRKLHAMWDSIPPSLKVSRVGTFHNLAEKASKTDGQVYDWPASWATGTLEAAGNAFEGISFSPLKNGTWQATLPPRYSTRMDGIKKAQLVKAGAHLAQLLREIWQ